MLGKIAATFLVLLFSTFQNSVVGQFTCDPATDCSTANPGDFVPDPADCLKYYICINGAPTPNSFDCPFGEYFSLTTGACEYGIGCGDNYCSGYNVACATECSTSSFIPYPGDCSKYYRCNDPGDAIGECTNETPYFNGVACVDDAQECCAVCRPECQNPLSFVIDPNDCHSFFFCDPNLELVSYTCSDGDYFNPVSLTCEVEETECSSYCPDGSPNVGALEAATTTTPGDDCYEGFECPVDEGSYTYCNECIPQYWKCTGGVASIESCSDTFVFDYTVQDCIPEEDCPTFGA